MQRHRLFAKRPKLGLVLHIFLQTACVYGSVAIIESYIRDVLCLKSTVVNASAIIYGITLPAVLSAVIGLVSDAWIGAFRGQLIGYRCWIIGALLLILSTIPQDMYNMSIFYFNSAFFCGFLASPDSILAFRKATASS